MYGCAFFVCICSLLLPRIEGFLFVSSFLGAASGHMPLLSSLLYYFSSFSSLSSSNSSSNSCRPSNRQDILHLCTSNSFARFDSFSQFPPTSCHSFLSSSNFTLLLAALPFPHRTFLIPSNSSTQPLAACQGNPTKHPNRILKGFAAATA